MLWREHSVYTTGMTFQKHIVNTIIVAEVVSSHVVLATAKDALDLLGNTMYQGYSAVILHQHNITPNFFDLQSGIAGEVFQKFTNYRMHLAIVCNTREFKSKSLRDLIHECNKSGKISFVLSVEEALKRLSTN